MFELLLGRNPAFQALLRDAQTAAAANVTVLVAGETGTGKELLAQALHHHSARAAKPYATLNCAAIAEGLAESELFGHRRGAFTGADADGTGRLRAAHGGTLFLDEVDSLAPALQAKLLRFLESGEIQPVGETATRKVDVRLVAATNADLEARVACGLFRADLYYRLNVLPLHIPPLRQRPDDVPLLASHFMRLFAARYQRREAGFSVEALICMAEYAWPGNIRELRNVCERLAIFRAGELVGVGDLPPEIPGYSRPCGPVAGFPVKAHGRGAAGFGGGKYRMN